MECEVVEKNISKKIRINYSYILLLIVGLPIILFSFLGCGKCIVEISRNGQASIDNTINMLIFLLNAICVLCGGWFIWNKSKECVVDIPITKVILFFLYAVVLVKGLEMGSLLLRNVIGYFEYEYLEEVIGIDDIDSLLAFLRYHILFLLPTIVGKIFGELYAKILFKCIKIVIVFLFVVIFEDNYSKIEWKKIVCFLFIAAPSFPVAFLMNAFDNQRGVKWPTNSLTAWIGIPLFKGTLEMLFAYNGLFFLACIFLLLVKKQKNFIFSMIWTFFLLFYSWPLAIGYIYICIIDKISQEKEMIKKGWIIAGVLINVISVIALEKWKLASQIPWEYVLLYVIVEVVCLVLIAVVLKTEDEMVEKYLWYALFLGGCIIVQNICVKSFINEMCFPMLLLIKWNICEKIFDCRFIKKSMGIIVFTTYLLVMGGFSSIITPLTIIQERIKQIDVCETQNISKVEVLINERIQDK